MGFQNRCEVWSTPLAKWAEEEKDWIREIW